MNTVIISAGGMAVDVLKFMKLKGITQFVDDFKRGDYMGYEIIGTVDEFIQVYNKISAKPKVYNCVGSISDNKLRNTIYEKLKMAGVITSHIILSKSISGNVKLGENVLINANCHIAHDCVIGNNVVISPSVTICGNVTIEDNVFIGAGSTIIQGLTIGMNTIIGAGSVVIKDIPPNSKAVGNPARLI